MSDRPAVLAVDGGNSKADLALLDRGGRTVAALRRPGFSHQTVGLEEARVRLLDAAATLRRDAGLREGEPLAEVGAFCLAGVDLPSDDVTLGSLLDELALTVRWSLTNDVFAVLRAGTDGPGVAVVCGAGMNAVGVADDGRAVRYPALGEVSGDLAAGGGWLGMQGLAMAIRGLDGRGNPTRLSHVVPEHFGLRAPLEVTEAIYEGRLSERRLLELAPRVLSTAAEGDEVALAVVMQLADEVVLTVRATVEKLDLDEAELPVVLGGGLFRATDGLLERAIEDRLRVLVPTANVHVLAHHPVVGAALLGFDALGERSAGLRATVRDTLDAAISANGSPADG